jgi:hypothetical protein
VRATATTAPTWSRRTGRSCVPWSATTARHAAELALLNKICPQQTRLSKARDGAKVTKKYDKAQTPHCRAQRHEGVGAEDRTIHADPNADPSLAAIHDTSRR